MINNSFPNVGRNTVYIVTGDVSCPHSVASNSGTLTCIAYNPDKSNNSMLNTTHLNGRPVFTSMFGLNVLRGQPHKDPALMNYKVKCYPSRQYNGGAGVWLYSDDLPV